MAQKRHFRISQLTRSTRRAAVFASASALALGLLSAAPATTPEAIAAAPTWGSKVVNVLVFHGPVAKQDDPVQRATNIIKKLGNENGFYVHNSDDPSVFTAENLARYRSVVFLSANGVTLNSDQEAAFQSYIKGGGGFLGVHDAAYAQPTSDWFTGLIGTRPAGSIPPSEKIVEITVNSENPPSEAKAQLIDGNNNTKWLARGTNRLGAR